MQIVYESERYFVIDKPEGFFVHPPEASPYPVPREKICLRVLEARLGAPVFPVHRLDAATSGLVVFARSRATTRALSALFAERAVEKRYRAVVRGFIDGEGVILLPLEIKGFDQKMESETRYRRIAQVELPFAVGRYPTARYSLAEVAPVTGRWHQIRRHFDRIAHPIVGDVDHGDTYHNRFFRDVLGVRGLCLRAEMLRFEDPWTKEAVEIRAPFQEKWQRLEALFRPRGA